MIIEVVVEAGVFQQGSTVVVHIGGSRRVGHILIIVIVVDDDAIIVLVVITDVIVMIIIVIVGQILVLLEESGANVFGNLASIFGVGLGKKRQFPIEHAPEFARRHFRHGAMRLNRLQLLQAPIQLLERLQSQQRFVMIAMRR